MTHRRSFLKSRCFRCIWLSIAILFVTAFSTTASELRRTAIVRAVESSRLSVVSIDGQKSVKPLLEIPGRDEPKQVKGMGTGVVIDERGYIITNHHVVEGVRNIHVTLTGKKTYLARLIAHDPKTDLAIIKIKPSQKLPVIKLGTSRDLMIGEPVLAIGNAYGYKHTVTRGIISALHRKVPISETQLYDDLIQTDASINPGNSGGPLLNIDGEMIGINVAVRAGAQGIGFSIPVDEVMEVAADLMAIKTLEHHWHGIVARKRSDGTRQGILVHGIEKGSPADKTDLRPGDILTAIGDRKVFRPLDLELSLLGRRSGEKIELAVQRNHQSETITITLAARPKRAESPSQRAWRLLGLKLRPILPKQLSKFRSRYHGGLAITAVRANSPAARQGIRPGDILVGMHVWETTSLDNVNYVLTRKDFAEFSPVKFYLVRGNETLYGHLTVALNKKRTNR